MGAPGLVETLVWLWAPFIMNFLNFLHWTSYSSNTKNNFLSLSF